MRKFNEGSDRINMMPGHPLQSDPAFFHLGEFWDEIHPVDDLIDAFGECFEDCAHRLKNLGESVVDAFD